MEFEGRLVFDRSGRYRFSFSGTFDQASGYDGEHAWERDPAGNVRQLQEGNANFAVLMNWFLTGDWLIAERGFALSLDQEASTSRYAVVQVDAGAGAVGTIRIDRKKGLPQRLETVQFGRKLRLNVAWMTAEGGGHLPSEVEIIDGGKPKIAWKFEAVRVLTEAPDFSQPVDDIKVVYDPKADPKLLAKKFSGGHLWVRPKLNGKDVGWFLFDTGASGTVIDSKIAKELGLEVVGQVDSTGIGGRTEVELRHLSSLELAGVRVEDIPVTSRDLSGAERSMGTKVAGYLGVDLLSHGVIVYDESAVKIEFHVPSAYKLPQGGEWQIMPIHNGKPCVRMPYEDHVGLFLIDTGAPGRLIFGPHAVERNKLLEDRKTTRSRAYGTGGSVAARKGEIEHVEFGGERFENIPTTFITEHGGAGADVLRDGIVGANLIRRFILVFDIEGERIAYLKR